ncbi:SDR family oxidoreductase [Sandaracinus amylolyticus]|uniref:SDR family oxidoreductase n=1 Tax=Sandaracinus amylolyticus TaxID=927083 RepID=UPI001F19A040|nr:SDR family oxidoreductase [Sandaracinus amylolyticus]UJR85285.1 Hypothetical protein I5071_73650 [Sandaracinus amylolyticus]
MQNKTVLVTGSSSGFGRDIAKHFAAQGWNVVATMRTPSDARELAELPNVLVTPLDVQDRASIDAAVEATIARFGRIDVVVNNAGFGLFGLFEATPREKVLEQLEVNVIGLMDVTRAVLPQLRAQRSGVVVNVTSGAGVFTLPMSSLYSASKFAVEGFSESLSYELAPLGIAVKLIEPGGVLSTRFNERAFGEAARNRAISDYDPFVTATMARFDELLAERRTATSADVAAVIFGAATDGTDRLRYVATPDIEPMVALRRSTSEDEYLRTMRARFGFRG